MHTGSVPGSTTPGRATRPGRVRPDSVWPLRRSPLARAILRTVIRVCLVMLAVVALVTGFFVWAFGHPVAWSVVGGLFAAGPLVVFGAAAGVGVRGAVGAGPRWVGIRLFRRWRVVDLGEVRAVRLTGAGPDTPGGFGRFGVFGGPGGPGGAGGGFGTFGRFGGGALGRSIVFEDASGGRVDITVDALDGGLADVVRSGLPPDVVIDPDAARALGAGASPSDEGDDRP